MAKHDRRRDGGTLGGIHGRLGRASVATVLLGMPLAAGVALAAAYASFAALPPVPFPPENPLTEQKRVLGKILFFEEQLSSTNSVSCATCHVMNRAGSDPRNGQHPGPDGVPGTPDDKRGSPGIFRSDAFSDFLRDEVFNTQVQVTSRSANSPINAAYAPSLFWDGRASGQFRDPQTGQVIIPVGGALESQAAGPPVNSVEMAHDDIDWLQVTSKLAGVRPLDLATNHPPDVSLALAGGVEYPELFRRAFGDTAITAARISMAIATYQRTLIADQTPWDAFVAGNPNAMTQAQRDGWQAFQASNCNLCHIPPLFTGNGFRNVGLRPPAEDRGLQETTGQFADRGKFKVPGLRNVGQKNSFMHTGMLPNLTEVIRFYARAPGAPPQFPDNQDPLMQQVNVPPQAAPLIEEFLRNGLLDPRVRDWVFPFDAPTLASERPEHRTTIIGGGAPGQGGFIPRIIADAPPRIGTSDFRVGVDVARGSAVARLAYSTSGPVNGRITPTAFVGEVVTSPGNAGTGLATFHWSLSPALLTDGQVIFLQWFVQDPAAVGGEALSRVARVPLFCGSWGCPPACPADFDGSGFVDLDDYTAYVLAFEEGVEAADFDGSGFVDIEDFTGFVLAFEGGC